MRLEPCAAVEVSLAQNWSAIGPTSAEVKVTFRGVAPSPGQCLSTSVPPDLSASMPSKAVPRSAGLDALRVMFN